MMPLDLTTFDVVRFAEGTIYLGPSDKKRSVGFLLLKPRSSLAKHNRPVEEWLVQVEGISEIILFDGNREVRRVVLQRGDTLKIPADQYHQHTNPTGEDSLTSWRFDGDIRAIIDAIRKQNKHNLHD